MNQSLLHSKFLQTVSLLGDEFCEELAHPHLFLESLARKLKGKDQLA